MDILRLAAIFQNTPELCSVFDYQAVQNYVEIISILKPKLSTYLPSYQTGPPPTLPANVHEFLKQAFSMSDLMGKIAWESFSKLAWKMIIRNNEEEALIRKHLKVFLQHGISHNVGIYNLQPSTRVCLDATCSSPLQSNPSIFRDRELVEEQTHRITIFTKTLGAIPAFSFSYYCRKCNTRYYANYYVSNASNADALRKYYFNLPKFIQSSQHFYVAIELCDLFATMLVTSCTSGTNCAHIYNQGFQNQAILADIPPDWQTSLQIDVEDVWSSFYIYSLILDHSESGSSLFLLHNAESQALRLQPALRARNIKMSGPGQEEWNHACDRCCYIYQDEEENYYQIRSTVTDGVTIGRPTCSIHDCKIPLRSVKDRFCPDHFDEAKKCAVVSCNSPIETGFRTCHQKDHRKIEIYQQQKGKAMFQLKQRLERLNVSIPRNGLSTTPGLSESEEFEGMGADADDDVLIDENGLCDSKPETGNRTARARFGRRWTHNEELCVASCGVILGRATFYGSEAPNGVRAFWMSLFPTRASLPFVLWHDNNCRIVSMLRRDADGEPGKDYFQHCALPVDVFHFKCKHKESDVECGQYCNPYLWPELRTEDGQWRFNSSAAEQANAWFGGFQAIVREMQVDRYEFFLDEMIKRRNRIIVAQLKKQGYAPYSIPRAELLQPDNVD